MRNGRKQGLFHGIGDASETVCIAEGYATAASIHDATGYQVFVAFDAGNLPGVAATVRQAWPDARLVICGDNDKPDKAGRRAGQEKAKEAAARVDGLVALPPVEGHDFNDWAAALAHAGEDFKAIKAQIVGAGKDGSEFMGYPKREGEKNSQKKIIRHFRHFQHLQGFQPSLRMIYPSLIRHRMAKNPLLALHWIAKKRHLKNHPACLST